MKTKKLFLILSLLCSLSLFTACSKEDEASIEDRKNQTESNLESFEGVIKGVSKNVYQEGTHEFETDEGLIYIQSAQINLNNYIGEKVIVQGLLKKPKGNAKPVLTVSEIRYAKNQEDSGEKASKPSKTYTNRDFGVEFKYPGTWLLTPSKSSLKFIFEEKPLAHIDILEGQTEVKSFAASQEGKEGVEVSVASQSAFRFISGNKVTFYVPNPPKKVIYKVEFNPSKEMGEEQISDLKEEFYSLIQSIKLIYLPQAQGKVCGGEPVVECPEGYFCELNDDSAFAEGVCAPMEGTVVETECPELPKPTCEAYQVSEYDDQGCPMAYQCDDAAQSEENFNLGGHYQVPEVSQVNREYVNEKLGFKMNYPSEWYFMSFGAQNGSQSTIGFSDLELQNSDEALITLTIQDTPGGKASKKVGDWYYVFNGPSDLTSVMKAMADSVQSLE